MPHYWFTDPTGRARRMMARDLPHAVERAQQALGGPWRVGQPMQAVALSSSEKMWLWRQLASAVAERAPLPQALSHIGQSAATGPARVAATRLAQLCAEGLSLAEALAAVPGVASRDELKFIAGAERLGRLPDAAEAMARLSELDNNTLADLAMRWIYPAFTAAVGLVALPVVAVLLHRFGHFPQPLSFADLGVSPHRSLAATAWGVAAYVPAVLLLLTVVAGAIAVIARWAGWSASPLWDRLLYSIPGYGSVVFHRRLGLFFEAIALGRRANLPDTQVMSLAIPVLGPSLHVAMLPAQIAVENGASIPEVLARCDLIPPFSRSRLLAAGPGSFCDVASSISREHRAMADYYARRFVTIVEPALVILVALGVAALMASALGSMVQLIITFTALGG